MRGGEDAGQHGGQESGRAARRERQTTRSNGRKRKKALYIERVQARRLFAAPTFEEKYLVLDVVRVHKEPPQPGPEPAVALQGY